MQMNHILAAGAFMKVIYVLCDHCQRRFWLKGSFDG